MKTIESTIDASHLSGTISVSDDTLDEILNWVSDVDKTPRLTREEAYTGEYTTINGYKVEVEVFEDVNHISIIDVENESDGVLLRVEELKSLAS